MSLSYLIAATIVVASPWSVRTSFTRQGARFQALLESPVLLMFALGTPLFFQVVMDKMLVHRGDTALDVIVVGHAMGP